MSRTAAGLTSSGDSQTLTVFLATYYLMHIYESPCISIKKTMLPVLWSPQKCNVMFMLWILCGGMLKQKV